MTRKKKKDAALETESRTSEGAAPAKKERPKPATVIRARYKGRAPVQVAQKGRTLMLWPNQVYKNLEETEDVAVLIKKRMLEKIGRQI